MINITNWINDYRKQENLLTKIVFFTFFYLFFMGSVFSQSTKSVSGIVKDDTGIPIPGVAVVVDGKSIGAFTGFDGDYKLSIPVDAKRLKFSYLGMKTQIIDIKNRSVISITMVTSLESLEEIVIVGYGKQEKREVTSAVVEIKGETLEKAGTPSNLAQALTGQLPGLTTLQSSGEPGNDQVDLFIRGKSSWNGTGPLILVDGIERPLTDIDVSEVASISVLKDAASTAVYGVLGANGVILVTTKRGKVGETRLNVTFNQSLKFNSKLPIILGSYDALNLLNEAIENELGVNPISWADYYPQEVVERWRDPNRDIYRYPDVDWQSLILKDVALSSRININLAGGTDFVKYFGSLAYTHEGDLYNQNYNQRFDYTPSSAYDRLNFRSNLDFTLTKTTSLKVNLSGFVGFKNQSNTTDFQGLGPLVGIYKQAPDVFPSQFPDGSYGYDPDDDNILNPLEGLNTDGLKKTTRTQLASDFTLTQDLKAIAKGLKFGARLAYDTYYQTTGRTTSTNSIQGRYIDPFTGEEFQRFETSDGTDFDFIEFPGTISSERINSNSSVKNLFYQFDIRYNRKFGGHKVSALALFNRREDLNGTSYPDKLESWVGRLTYAYKSKYFAKISGAYNGSDNFGPGYKFDFFPSAELGWDISKETFLDNLDWLGQLKLAYSIGQVGSDRGIPKYAYTNTFNSGGRLQLGWPFLSNQPYILSSEGNIANPDLRWETATKQNFKLETRMFRGDVHFSVDYFRDDREDIFISASGRNIPVVFGAAPVAANIGSTKVRGFELQLDLKRKINLDSKVWLKANFTHSKDDILNREDPVLLPDYLKQTGFQIGQTRSQIDNGFLNNWDDVYGSVNPENNLNTRLPGDLDIIDFNADGLINGFDVVPFGYPSRPQNNYSLSLGYDYKGFSAMVQLYGVNNVTRNYRLERGNTAHTFFEDYQNYWRPDNTNARYSNLRWNTGQNNTPAGTQFLYDGSYIKLQTAEVAYTFKREIVKTVGLNSLRVYINGNNLWFKSNMPQDIEVAQLNTNQRISFYPLNRRVNLGFNLQF